jgi:hypothetical protein
MYCVFRVFLPSPGFDLGCAFGLPHIVSRQFSRYLAQMFTVRLVADLPVNVNASR